jgi:hypothetical protein
LLGSSPTCRSGGQKDGSYAIKTIPSIFVKILQKLQRDCRAYLTGPTLVVVIRKEDVDLSQHVDFMMR